jgi:hypothetical protein
MCRYTETILKSVDGNVLHTVVQGMDNTRMICSNFCVSYFPIVNMTLSKKDLYK